MKKILTFLLPLITLLFSGFAFAQQAAAEPGFFTGIFISAFALATSLWFIVGLAVFILWLAHVDSTGWSLMWVALLSFLVYSAFAIPPLYAGIFAIAYLPIGGWWSGVRWKNYTTTLVNAYNRKGLGKTGHSYDLLCETVNPAENKTRLGNWVVVWPFSMVDNVVGDTIDLVLSKMSGYYMRVTTAALQNVK